MATRTPAAFTITQPDFDSRQPVLAAAVDDMYDNQQLVLEKHEMLVGDQFCPVYSSNPAGWITMRRYLVRAPNLCVAGTTINCSCTMRVWSNNAANFDIGVYNSQLVTRWTLTIAGAHSLVAWRQYFTFQIQADGTENELLIQVNDTTSPASPAIYLMGVGLFTG